jgi:hypothetical protein
MDGEAELGHTEVFVINCATWFPDLSTSHRRASPWPPTAFTERYCIKCGPTAPVLPELRADVRDQIPLVISEPVSSKKILALQMRGTDSHGWGRNLVTYLRSRKTTVGVSAFTERYCIKVRPNGSCPARVACRCPIKFRSSFQNLFYQRRYWLSDARYRFMDGEEGWNGHVLVKL